MYIHRKSPERHIMSAVSQGWKPIAALVCALMALTIVTAETAPLSIDSTVNGPVAVYAQH